MRILVRTLLYAGLDSAEFEALKDDALAETLKSLRTYSMFATIMFIVMAVFELVTNGHFADNIGIYIGMTLICAFVRMLSRRMLPTHPDLVLPLAYLLVMVMYVFALTLTMRHTDLPAVTFIAVLVLAPLLFTDRPVYIVLMNIAATAVLCVLSYMFKPQDIAIGDEWNGITLCAISVAAAVFQRRLRFRALSQARHIRYLSEVDLLTGARNRNMFEHAFPGYADRCKRSVTCVYADANGLHELNDTQDHEAGDAMLQTMARALLKCYGSENVYRIGGDEFVVLRMDAPEGEVTKEMRDIGADLSARGYDIAVGIASGARGAIDMKQLRIDAEKAMYKSKQLYYQQPGHERRKR